MEAKFKNVDPQLNFTVFKNALSLHIFTGSQTVPNQYQSLLFFYD